MSREDAARFSFLLATPVILAAGVLKLGDLAGPLGDGIRPQVIFGSLLSGVGAYLSVRFLTRYLANRSLRPFGVYCLDRRRRESRSVRRSLTRPRPSQQDVRVVRGQRRGDAAADSVRRAEWQREPRDDQPPSDASRGDATDFVYEQTGFRPS